MGGDSIYYYATAAYAELVYEGSDCSDGIEKVSFSYHMNGLYHGYTDKRDDGVIYSGPLSVVASSVVWSKRGDQGQSETAWNAADVHLDGASSFKFVFQFGTAYAPMVEAIGNVAVKCRNPIATALDYIDAHNAKRALHQNTPDVVYDATLAAGAQAYANTCPMVRSPASFIQLVLLASTHTLPLPLPLCHSPCYSASTPACFQLILSMAFGADSFHRRHAQRRGREPALEWRFWPDSACQLHRRGGRLVC